MASNFRALYTLQHNLNAKQQKRPDQLWPLSFDEGSQLTSEEMYERNRQIISAMEAAENMN